jgi:hypothetical protein
MSSTCLRRVLRGEEILADSPYLEAEDHRSAGVCRQAERPCRLAERLSVATVRPAESSLRRRPAEEIVERGADLRWTFQVREVSTAVERDQPGAGNRARRGQGRDD